MGIPASPSEPLYPPGTDKPEVKVTEATSAIMTEQVFTWSLDLSDSGGSNRFGGFRPVGLQIANSLLAGVPAHATAARVNILFRVYKGDMNGRHAEDPLTL